MLVYEWIAIVRLQVIYFWYSECKSFTIYYIDFTFSFSVIRRLKNELVFNWRRLDDMFDCDVGTPTSRWIMHFYFTEWNTSIYFTWKPQYSAYIYIINIIIPSILFTFVLFYRFVYFVPWNFCNQFFGHMLLDIVIYNKINIHFVW